MATSGSVDFTVNRDELIKSSLRVMGVLAEGETPSSTQINEASQALNMMVKHWQTQGIHLWKFAEVALIMPLNTAQYAISSSGDNAALASDFVKTEVATAAASGATTLVVDSGTGIAASDIISIQLDDGTLQFTTVSSISTATITLAAALTDTVAVDNHVYTYTNKLNRPLRVHSARTVQSDGTEIPITTISKSTYFDLPNKTTGGSPTQVYYDPQLVSGQLYTWPINDNVQQYMRLTVSMPLEDFDAATDTPDLPQEWLASLKFNLAAELSYEYGLDDSTFSKITAMAQKKLDEVLGFDAENISIQFVIGNDDTDATDGWT